MAVIHL